MVVRGPRLSLRYARPDDADALFELGRDAEVTRFFSWGPYDDVAQARAFIERMEADREEGRRLEFVIVGGDDVPIGITGLSEFGHRDRRAVVGTWLGRAHWGSGANRDSKALILALAFGGLGLQRVSAYAHPENERSLRALDRLGFTREGVLVAWHLHHGSRRDVAILRLLREDWQAGELAGEPVELEGAPPSRISAGNAARP
ncbi:MAG: GNAT family N-acetyltransferase [Thermoleophilaceae bacterium]